MHVVSLVPICTAYYLSLRTNAASPSCWLSVNAWGQKQVNSIAIFCLESCTLGELRA